MIKVHFFSYLRMSVSAMSEIAFWHLDAFGHAWCEVAAMAIIRPVTEPINGQFKLRQIGRIHTPFKSPIFKWLVSKTKIVFNFSLSCAFFPCQFLHANASVSVQWIPTMQQQQREWPSDVRDAVRWDDLVDSRYHFAISNSCNKKNSFDGMPTRCEWSVRSAYYCDKKSVAHEPT